MTDQVGLARFYREGYETYLLEPENIDTYWDNNYDLDDPKGWEQRYIHETVLISNVIDKHGVKNILELGSGPGVLGNKVLDKYPNIIYDRVDGPSALAAYKRRQYKGRKFLVKDMWDSFDTDGLEREYDLVVMNDFLEHIRNPSLIIDTCRNKLMTEPYFMFISVPNWRTKHHFIYPGLFDFDNFCKFMMFEGFSLSDQGPTWSDHVPLQNPRLANVETTLPQKHVYDWNWYLLFKLNT